MNIIKQNPSEVVKYVSRRRLINFGRYINAKMECKPFHLVYYEILNRFAHGEIKKLIVQQPPQHGKSEGSSRLLPAFMLGLNPDLKICIGSYSASVAKSFNSDVQKIIDTREYRELFPDTFLSGMSGAAFNNIAKRNSDLLEIVGHRGYLYVVGRGGSLTSKSVDVMIMDDLYKDYAEGNSPVIREAAWKWYTTVVRTRLHNDSQELIVFTRWNEDDIIGRIEKSGETIIEVHSWSDIQNIPKGAWVRINFEAIKTGEPTEIDERREGEPLWEEKHSLDSLIANRRLDPVQFNCLYQGNPSSVEGRLFHPFKTYIAKEEYGSYIRSGCYIDVADEGSDMLCAFCYDVYKSDNVTYNEQKRKFEPIIYALITDIIATDAPTEITAVTVPDMINRNGTQKVWVESNNGGSQYGKTISKKIKATTTLFYQGANKESRVITASAAVNAQIIFPFGWETRFKFVHDHLEGFLRNFRANEHDDIEDALTGVYEKELADGNILPYGMAKRGVKVRN